MKTTSPPTKPGLPPWLSVSLLAIVAVGFWWVGQPKRAAESIAPSSTPAPVVAPSKERDLAVAVCSTCHIFPEPGLFERYQWSMEILPRMTYSLGLQPFDFARHPGGDLVRATGMFPPNPVISYDQWRTVVNYYLENSPSQEPPSPPRPAIELGLPGFKVEALPAQGPVRLTMAAIDAQRRQIILSGANELEFLNAQGVTQKKLSLPSPATHVLFRTNAPDLVTLIGSFMPSDIPEGQVLALDQSAAPRLGSALIKQLPRPTQTLEADFDADGRSDLLMCGFGNYVGRLSWWRSLPNDRWEEHVLEPIPGAVSAGISDFDGDGKPDVAVLMAQARESIVLHLNRGTNVWQRKVVREFHPAWGSSYLQAVDFNRDGRLDLLVSNGDNADSDSGVLNNTRPPRKAWHGLRLYEQGADHQFTEKWFLPLHGAYRALAADFNQDGLMDVAAVSYFPDYERSPQESFVLFLQTAPGKFRACSMPESLTGRWLTLDVGDLDGDGDADIVLASLPDGPGRVPTSFAQAWSTKGNRLLILRNQLK